MPAGLRCVWQAYNPRPFCNAFKDSRGLPVDVTVQMDAQQYFLGLLDRLEMQLKGTPQANLLQNTLRGSFMNQLMCQGGCNTTRETPEDFYSVALEVCAPVAQPDVPGWRPPGG